MQFPMLFMCRSPRSSTSGTSDVPRAAAADAGAGTAGVGYCVVPFAADTATGPADLNQLSMVACNSF